MKSARILLLSLAGFLGGCAAWPLQGLSEAAREPEKRWVPDAQAPQGIRIETVGEDDDR